ncbi:MAG: hypothetical protein ACK5W0_04790 [Labrys sp. (in: a-proteobacteria)]
MTVALPREALEALLRIARAGADRLDATKFYRLFPDTTTVWPDGSVYHARDLYPRHLEHMAAGKRYRERLFMAANRVGKTICGGYEVTCHVTGLYRPWWEGRVFQRPVRVWAAGKTNESTRDIVQKALLGDVTTIGGRKTFTGTGLIPRHRSDRRRGSRASPISPTR